MDIPTNQFPSPETPHSNEATYTASTHTLEQIIQVTHPEITTVTYALIDTLTTNAEDKVKLQELWAEYDIRTEAYIDTLEDPMARTEAQIAARINKASVFHTAGRMTRYLEELDDAEVYAANAGLSLVAASLDAEIKNNIEKIDLSPEKIVLKLRSVIDDANREFLKDSIRDGADIQDIIGDAYGMLLEEGQDPDEIFELLGIIE